MRERKERERVEQIRRNEAEYAARLATEESAASQRRREIEARAALRAETRQRQEDAVAADIAAAISRRRAAYDKRSKHFAHIVAGLDGAGVGDVQGYHDMRYAAGHAYKGDWSGAGQRHGYGALTLADGTRYLQTNPPVSLIITSPRPGSTKCNSNQPCAAANPLFRTAATLPHTGTLQSSLLH